MPVVPASAPLPSEPFINHSPQSVFGAGGSNPMLPGIATHRDPANPWEMLLGPTTSGEKPDQWSRRSVGQYNMPHAYEGQSEFLQNRVENLQLMRGSFYTDVLAPIVYKDKISFSWSQYEFPSHIAGPTPHETTPRMLTSKEFKRRVILRRSGIAFEMEYEHMLTEHGRMVFLNHLVQMSRAVIHAIQLEVMRKIRGVDQLDAEGLGNGDKGGYEEQGIFEGQSMHKLMRQGVSQWFGMLRHGTLQGIISDAREQILRMRGTEPDVILMPFKAQQYLQMYDAERTTYKGSGMQGYNKFEQDAQGLTTLMGLRVYIVSAFINKEANIDLMRHVGEIGEVYMNKMNIDDGSSSQSASRLIYNEDSNCWQEFGLEDVLENCNLYGPDGELVDLADDPTRHFRFADNLHEVFTDGDLNNISTYYRNRSWGSSADHFDTHSRKHQRTGGMGRQTNIFDGISPVRYLGQIESHHLNGRQFNAIVSNLAAKIDKQHSSRIEESINALSTIAKRWEAETWPSEDTIDARRRRTALRLLWSSVMFTDTAAADKTLTAVPGPDNHTGFEIRTVSQDGPGGFGTIYTGIRDMTSANGEQVTFKDLTGMPGFQSYHGFRAIALQYGINPGDIETNWSPACANDAALIAKHMPVYEEFARRVQGLIGLANAGMDPDTIRLCFRGSRSPAAALWGNAMNVESFTMFARRGMGVVNGLAVGNTVGSDYAGVGAENVGGNDIVTDRIAGIAAAHPNLAQNSAGAGGVALDVLLHLNPGAANDGINPAPAVFAASLPTLVSQLVIRQTMHMLRTANGAQGVDGLDFSPLSANAAALRTFLADPAFVRFPEQWVAANERRPGNGLTVAAKLARHMLKAIPEALERFRGMEAELMAAATELARELLAMSEANVEGAAGVHAGQAMHMPQVQDRTAEIVRLPLIASATMAKSMMESIVDRFTGAVLGAGERLRSSWNHGFTFADPQIPELPVLEVNFNDVILPGFTADVRNHRGSAAMRASVGRANRYSIYPAAVAYYANLHASDHPRAMDFISANARGLSAVADSNSFSKRFLDISRMASHVQRIVAIAYCTVSSSQQSMLELVRNDVMLPWRDFIARPHMSYHTYGIVLMKAGEETMVVYRKQGVFMVSGDGHRHKFYCNYMAYYAPEVFKSENIRNVNHVLPAGYIGGSGVGIYKKNTYIPGQHKFGGGSLFFMLTSLSQMKNIPSPMSITGYYRMYDPRITDNKIPDNAACHYDTAPLYVAYWGWQLSAGYSDYSTSSHKGFECDRQPPNEIMYNGRQKAFNVKVGDFTIDHPGNGHFQGDDLTDIGADQIRGGRFSRPALSR